MNVLLTALASCIAACAVQPLVVLVWLVIPRLVTGGDRLLDLWFVVSVFAAFYAAPFAAILGIPLTLALWRKGRFRWWPLAAVGTVAGAAFAGALIGSGTVRIDAGGDRATALGVLQNVLVFATHGLVGATAFYQAWRMGLGRAPSSAPQPVRGSE